METTIVDLGYIGCFFNASMCILELRGLGPSGSKHVMADKALKSSRRME